MAIILNLNSKKGDYLKLEEDTVFYMPSLYYLGALS